MASMCIACGMPMESAEDHALGDISKPYCRYCARGDGAMQSYSEKRASFVSWLVSTQGLDPTAARDQAVMILGRLPAWRGIVSSID